MTKARYCGLSVARIGPRGEQGMPEYQEARGAYHSPWACGVSVGTRKTSVCRGGEQERKEARASNREVVLGSRPRGDRVGKGRRGNERKQGSR